MAKQTETYREHVDHIEANLALQAKRSFEPFSPQFIDGGPIYEHYEREWRKPEVQLKYLYRTPLQIERDRILYSNGLRKQTEKYHVLYNGRRRIVRNYTTHTMRMTQVARSICRGLKLNADFGEAIALGSKVGAVPFIHTAKSAIADWVVKKVESIDGEYAKTEAGRPVVKQHLFDFGDTPVPSWVNNLRSLAVRERVQRYIPWAAAKDPSPAYSAGQESYWLLCTNPFVLEANPNTFAPETMFGIWRHTLGLERGRDSFHHKCPIDKATSGYHELKWSHSTYEAIVVQYADDITWVIENLDDANTAALLNERPTIYQAVLASLGDAAPNELIRPLANHDSGGLYTYFIADFVRHSEDVLEKLGTDGTQGHVALREGKPESYIGSSPEGEEVLGKLIRFLYDSVFTEARVKSRAQMLRTVTLATMDLLYGAPDDLLQKLIREKANRERWAPERLNKAVELMRDEIHRIQISVDIFADMGDQEVYDFVGIQSL